MDLSNCKTINDRAAAYAGEIIRLERINADLLAALETLANDFSFILDGDDMSGMSDHEMFTAFLETARAAIRKAKGE